MGIFNLQTKYSTFRRGRNYKSGVFKFIVFKKDRVWIFQAAHLPILLLQKRGTHTRQGLLGNPKGLKNWGGTDKNQANEF